METPSSTPRETMDELAQRTEKLRQALHVQQTANLTLRQQAANAAARVGRQRKALRQLNRAYDRMRDSNSVLRHMLEVSEQTRKPVQDYGIVLPKEIQPWQAAAFEKMMRQPTGTAHTMGAGRDHSKPSNHNHVKPCDCGIFDPCDTKARDDYGINGMSAPWAILDEGTPNERFIPFDGALDAPWYRRAWDWLVFHTTRAFTPDEVDDWSMPIYVIMQNNGKPVAAYTSKSEAEDIAKDMWRYPAGTSFAVNKVELY